MILNRVLNVFLLMIFLNGSVYAFELEKIEFKHSSNNKYAVDFLFYGKNLNPPLSMLNKEKQVKDKKLSRYKNFFQKLYSVNLKID